MLFMDINQIEQLDRIEAKLDVLLEVLAEEDAEVESEASLTLDGQSVGVERDSLEAL